MTNDRVTIPLFYPYVSSGMRKAAYIALGEKIIGQGKKVETFERKLSALLGTKNLLTVNNGTAALELAYQMLGLGKGDEVVSPVFTCTATNIPLSRRGVKIVFADVKDNMMLDWDDVERKITKKTKAIINVHMFDQMNGTRDLGIPVIGDSAQYLGKTHGEKFTAYSFQATKILTTADGGALVCASHAGYKRAKLLRWYGIDRETGRDNIDVDIKEAGFNFRMNNVTASIGIAGFKILSRLAKDQKALRARYEKLLGTRGGSPFLIHVKDRKKMIAKLAANGVEAGIVHKRNDIYSVFGGKRQNLPNMNRLENTYLLLPCHNHMTLADVDFICKIVKATI